MEICIVDMVLGKHVVNRGAGSNTGTGICPVVTKEFPLSVQSI